MASIAIASIRGHHICDVLAQIQSIDIAKSPGLSLHLLFFLPPFPPLSVSLCLSLSLIDPDQDVEAKLEDLAALPNGGRAISDDIKQLLSRWLRFMTVFGAVTKCRV